MKFFLTLLGVIFLTGCQAMDPLSGAGDPHARWWRLGFVAPDYMTVWVETAAVEDVHGKLIERVSSGVAPSAQPEDGTESARGWNRVGTNGRPAVGAALPRRVFVRWQSIVEARTYRAWVDIPDEARQVMHDSTARRCPEHPEEPSKYSAGLTLGLAPGGVIQAWVRDECYRPIKVARGQAEVEPLGPHQGRSGGHYYPLPEASKRYIERFGIPYGSW
ncbi:DUF2931 family protein [Stutzerimonas nitrititolerans]|uniref:DUF2931 family protein n=1 Tax=Stutzerimonas nitrititolerans TaxID=2482751 RepID=UPI0007188EC6|nr:DUF2931 family protein [Stutzerimonas nitrititolerans]KRW63218.1 hypothetical protein AO729_08120 [Pseudomonas sp. TTU2014-066ASC]